MSQQASTRGEGERAGGAAAVTRLLDRQVRLAPHAVHRSFARETVVLDLSTARYHGLDLAAGRMLELLERAPTARGVVPRLAREWGMAPHVVERDLGALCAALLAQGLVEVSGEPD